MASKHSQSGHGFDSSYHIRSLAEGPWFPMCDSLGHTLEGIQGRAGAVAVDGEGLEVGIDLIEMRPDSSFELHTHLGFHAVFVLSGQGWVHIDHSDHPLRGGDSVLIPPDCPHLMRADSRIREPFRLLVMSWPHHHLSARHRVNLFTEPGVDLE